MRWFRFAQVLSALFRALVWRYIFEADMSNFSFLLNADGNGKVVIGPYQESFIAELSFWGIDDYVEHWRTAEDVLKGGNPVSFIISITDPENSNFIRSWVCYPIEHELVFQEHIIFLDDLDVPFNVSQPHENVQTYEATTEEGDKISEWRIKI